MPSAPSERSARTPWLRLATLTLVLIALNVAMADGLLQLRNQPAIPRRPLILFTDGWRSFLPVLLALWLTWGGGSIAWRLPLVLSVAALGIVVARFWGHEPPYEAFQTFLQSFLTFCVAIFGIHVLLVPLRGYFGWEFWFLPTTGSNSSARAMRWSLFQIVGYTAFAAFPLAFARLLARWHEYWYREPPGVVFWLTMVVEMGLALLAAAAVMLAIFFGHLRRSLRLAVVPLVFGAIFGAILLLAMLQGRPTRILDALFNTLGIMSAAIVNLALIRLAGIKLFRPKSNEPGRIAEATVDR